MNNDYLMYSGFNGKNVSGVIKTNNCGYYSILNIFPDLKRNTIVDKR